MERLRAQQIITAHAACTIIDGCKLCPLYKMESERTKQRGICQESISANNIREALVVLHDTQLNI